MRINDLQENHHSILKQLQYKEEFYNMIEGLANYLTKYLLSEDVQYSRSYLQSS